MTIAKRVDVGFQKFTTRTCHKDNIPAEVGTGEDAKLGEWNSVYMEGHNPMTGMWEACPALAYADPNVATIFNDDFYSFVKSESADAQAWQLTLVDGDTDNGETFTIADDVVGGVLVSTSNDAAADQNSMQVNGTSFKLLTDKPLWFGARVRVADVDQTNGVIGLCAVGADLYNASGGGVFFRFDHDASIDCVVEAGTAETAADTLADQTDATYHRYGIYWDGAAIYFYVDGVLTNTPVVTNKPTVFLTPSIEFETNGAAAEVIYVDYVRVVQLR